MSLHEQTHEYIFELFAQPSGKLLFSISHSGELKFGDGVSPSEAATALFDAYYLKFNATKAENDRFKALLENAQAAIAALEVAREKFQFIVNHHSDNQKLRQTHVTMRQAAREALKAINEVMKSEWL